MEIVNSLGKAGLLIKDVSETVKNEVKEQKGGYVRENFCVCYLLH